MIEPGEEKIKELKARFPERSLHRVEVVISGETYILLMTGPSTVEHKKFNQEALAATDIKDTADKLEALRKATLFAVLAQTRWPDRDEVQRLFEYSPEAIDAFPDILHEHAGSAAEVRSKKL